MGLVIGLVISISVIIYIAADARNYDRSPWGWGFFALFFGFLALGIYLCLTQRKGWGIFWISIWVVGEVINLMNGRLLL